MIRIKTTKHQPWASSLMRRVNILQTKKLRIFRTKSMMPSWEDFPRGIPPQPLKMCNLVSLYLFLHPSLQTKRASSHLSQGSIRTCALSQTITQQRWRLKNLSLKVFKTESVVPIRCIFPCEVRCSEVAPAPALSPWQSLIRGGGGGRCLGLRRRGPATWAASNPFCCWQPSITPGWWIMITINMI